MMLHINELVRALKILDFGYDFLQNEEEGIGRIVVNIDNYYGTEEKIIYYNKENGLIIYNYEKRKELKEQIQELKEKLKKLEKEDEKLLTSD